jgi:hypothetical protein
VNRETSNAARGSVVAGLASVATLPVAIFLTRYSDTYELLQAGLAIPLGVGLGLLSLGLAGRASRRGVVLVQSVRAPRMAVLGRVLGITGLCMAAAGIVALGVYGLLEYVGSRE